MGASGHRKVQGSSYTGSLCIRVPEGIQKKLTLHALANGITMEAWPSFKGSKRHYKAKEEVCDGKTLFNFSKAFLALEQRAAIPNEDLFAVRQGCSFAKPSKIAQCNCIHGTRPRGENFIIFHWT